MMKKYFFCIFFLFITTALFAQKEASHWFFGANAGLDFSSGNPIADVNGSLNTLEGCATISNVSGNLLFYTDGTTVWNRNHDTMPHGNNLFGNSSSSQSAIIVPKPKNINTYYIFTVDWALGTNGLNYYTIDMTLNGGLGDVVGTNNTPSPTNLLMQPIGEKITAVKVDNQDAFWVISNKEGIFHAFKVDSNGVDSNPVLSNTEFLDPIDPRGYLKASPDGTMIVSANMTTSSYIYNFDSATGILSNEMQLDLLGEFAYGAEFSPLSKKLYISTGNLSFNNETGEVEPAIEKLFQFSLDIPNPTISKINATRLELHSYTNTRAALQLAMDGKIYRAIDNSSFLGVINFPDADGVASNYSHNAISLGGKYSKQGLPPFIQSFFAANIQPENICFGDLTSFTIDSNEPILSITWDFGDGSSPSTSLSPTHTYASSGNYTINIEVTTASEIEIISQNITIFDLPNIASPITLQQCDDDTDGISFFNLREVEELISVDYQTSNFSYHFTQSDAQSNINLIGNLSNFSNEISSQVYVRVENQFGCYEVATVNLQVSTIASNLLKIMLTIHECDNELIDGDDTNGVTTFNFSSTTQDILSLFSSNQNLVVSYYENIADALAEENAIDSMNFRNESAPFSQQIVVRVDDQSNNSCQALGFHITLEVSQLPDFSLVSEEFLCLNNESDPLVIKVDNPQDNYTYEWRDQNGILLDSDSISSELEVFMAGDYYVTATSIENCQRTQEISIIPSNIATIERIDVTDDSDNNTITIIVTGEGGYEFALNDSNGFYQDENIFENVPGGIHTIYIRDKNGCGSVSQDVAVITYPKFFTPNGDGFNDTWQILGIGLQPISKIYIFDRFGKILTILDAFSEGWDGTYLGNEMPQSDYWFKAELEDGRVRRGHFSLIRR